MIFVATNLTDRSEEETTKAEEGLSSTICSSRRIKFLWNYLKTFFQTFSNLFFRFAA